MEPENPRNGDNDEEGTTTTDQIKLKAQEIAKRFEKYQGRYHTSSRCNTPLPITSADSIESIHSTSVISETSEKLLLFRQFLENDRKLVEDDKLDERKYSNDDGQANNDESLDVQSQSKKEKENLKYYENVIEAQYNEKNIQSLKNKIVELNEKLKNCQKVICEKDVLLESKIEKIESLSKTMSQKNKLHLETVDALKKRNIEIINDERLKFSQKINHVVEETEELKHNLDYIDQKYDELRKSNIKIERENNELRKKESYLMSEIEQLSTSYENEKKLLLEQNHKSSMKVVEDLEKELRHLQQENNSLKDHVSLVESKSIDTQEYDKLQTKLNSMENELCHLQQENNSLKDHVSMLDSKSISTQENDNNLRNKLNSMKKKLSNLQQENNSLKDHVSLLESKSISTQENDNNLQMKLISMEKELCHLQQENDSLKDHVSMLESKLVNTQENDNLLTKLNFMEKELCQLQQENNLLKNHVSALESKSVNIQENDNLRIKLNSMEKEFSILQQENDSLKDHVSMAESKSINTQEYDNLRIKLNSMGKELYHLQQENDSLRNHVSLVESKSSNNQKNDNLLAQLHIKEDEIQRLDLENKKLNTLYDNLKVEVQETENRWTQLKDAYLNDKNRMTFLEKVIEELKINNDELSSSNGKLNENLEKYTGDMLALKTENSACNERIADLMAVIENMRGQFEKALKDSSVEYEHDKKQLIQQLEHEKSLLKNCNNKLEESTLSLNKVTDQLNIVLKENDSFKCERLELDSCIGRNNAKISELNNAINELHSQMSQMTNELEFLRKENFSLSDKVNRTTLELEENKLLSDRFLKQKQLLKVKVKALKESENNCSLLQQKVMSLTEQIQDFNKKSNNLDQNDNKIGTMLHYCDTELQICHELFSTIVTKFNVQTQNVNTIQNVLVNLSSLFPIDCFDDVCLAKLVDSVSNNNLNDSELHSCLKKIIMGSIKMFEYIIHLKHAHKLSESQLVARAEVDKLIAEATEKVKMSTENEYKRQNNELLSLIENLQRDNHMLKLNIAADTQVLESRGVLTDLHGSTVTDLFSLNIFDVENMKNENDTLKQFLKNIHEKLGLVGFEETNNVELLSSLRELELLVQEIKNENLQLKSQCFEHQKLLTLKPVERPVEQQIDKFSVLNSQNAFIQPTEIVEEYYGNEEKLKLISENESVKQNYAEKSNPVVNDDSKMLLVRYKNLKNKFKEVRAKMVELENKIVGLTNDLEYANSKYKQLNDQYVSSNETHEADIVNCQSEIENLMAEKLEAHRQLTALKEKHEILQNDYDQLKSNLDDKISSNDINASTNVQGEQYTLLKGQLNDVQRLIDSAYSKVLCEWPPSNNSNLDWVLVQSKKLDDIINAKCISSNSGEDDFGFGDSEIKRLKSCVQIINELVTSILTNKYSVEVSPTDELVDLMSKIKSYTETFLEFISVKNSDLHLVNERHIELSRCAEDSDKNAFLSEQHLLADEPPVIIEHLLPLTEDQVKSAVSENEGNEHFQRAIAERDRLIEFLSEKISKLDNLSRSVDDIILIRHKLDKALTAVHERDVRCDELTLELTRLLEERDMLQLKLSNSIRQIQFLSDHKPQRDESNLSEETYGSKNIDDKLEELHSLEYRRDADLFNDQEQRHKSQMLLHQGHQNSSTAQESVSSNTNEEVNTSQSWFKDILSW